MSEAEHRADVQVATIRRGSVECAIARCEQFRVDSGATPACKFTQDNEAAPVLLHLEYCPVEIRAVKSRRAIQCAIAAFDERRSRLVRAAGHCEVLQDSIAAAVLV